MELIWAVLTSTIGNLIFIVIGIQAIYLLIFAVAGLFYSEKRKPDQPKLHKFIIYIPSYKEDEVILDTAQKSLQIDYPIDLYHVVIIADSLKKETIDQLKTLPLQVVEVKFEKSTKAKALNKALDVSPSGYDYAIVFDADNVAKEDYLKEMNIAFTSGIKVVQGQRTAKNKNNELAILDGISEGINNHIFRKGHRSLGLSSAIIGSAMGLEFKLYERVMRQLTAVGGFDKEMELYLLKNKIRVGYAQNAIVYDEKIQQAAVLENQRKRWLSAQVTYLKKHFGSGITQLLTKGNIDYFDKVFQMAVIPRVILIGILPVLWLISFIHGNAPAPSFWFGILLIGYFAILISIPRQFVNKELFLAILKLPTSIFTMFKLLFKLKGANKTFIHTPHGTISENKEEKK
ncbi:Glycosyltransferase, catalytic subunit of cellulose synthase and poly-beta-1,6-N-acetylglucosamine synthase [Algoriphagus faecimaris]|uniref:Glycosyltransferase, catalytic subunit of cellulose synthase and poly-beta-1,6-N-acetylglucosamine synthase n=1 Tax=Algoriphagus faecimaris TaxID=686796 RepID=A0A1G6NRD3_9BACT|nr:glycosyltransferase family 2 protein [Algoriphagus faecimaris]SDC69817.1 Glycosyltransferase, catalytic subunit of cellulose synthase and poly-beta-1,6-N-acetylglucosamine synthase [Algoriphagus faecimaris]